MVGEREGGSRNGGTLGRLRAREPESGIPRGRGANYGESGSLFYGGMLEGRGKLAFPFGAPSPVSYDASLLSGRNGGQFCVFLLIFVRADQVW